MSDPVTFPDAVVIVAHPDDETIWAGGLILLNPEVRWTIITLCRGSDPDRSPKFFRVIEELGADGAMGDLDDGPDQTPLSDDDVEETILSLLPDHETGLLITHGPAGEYTRHRRHEEVSRAVRSLWRNGRLRAAGLWMFAYEDGGGRYSPRAVESAHRFVRLDGRLAGEKRRLVTDVYGFGRDGFEARAAADREAFWCFGTHDELSRWLDEGEVSS